MIVRVRSLPLWVRILFTLVAGGCAMAAGAAGPTTAPGADDQRLIAHGTDDRFWIGVVRPGAKDRPDETKLYVRRAGEQEWHFLTRLESRVVALNSRGTQLAVLVDGGGWYLVSDDSTVTGPPISNGGQILAFGNDDRSLWAIGKGRATPTTKNASTSPSTTPSTAPAAPTTAPSPTNYGLYWLGSTDWNRTTDLPAEIPAKSSKMSLAFIDRDPYVAWQSKPSEVAVWRHAGGKQWEPVGTISPGFDILQFKLLSGTPGPMLWIAGEGQHAAVYAMSGGKFTSKPLPAELMSDSRAEAAAAAFAAGRTRVVVSKKDGAITEYTFDASDSTSTSTTMPIRLPAGPSVDIMQWLLVVSAAGLISAMLTSVRRREEMRELMLDPDRRPPLASIYRRFIAGVIDASPLLIVVGLLVATGKFGFQGMQTNSADSTVTPERAQLYWSLLILSGSLYLAHTVFGELVAGRSLGKMIMRLRVVGLDGKPATPGSILVRNAMRVVDLTFLLMPLTLILLSPLRQRAGDIAAGTLVVLDAPKRTSEAEQPPPQVPRGTDEAGK